FVFKFQGQFYITGLFTVNTSPMEFYGLMRHNGAAWEPVPGFEIAAPIKSIKIHENKLYIGGYFTEVQGAPGNGIAVFDGTNWDNLGGGVLWDLDEPSEGNPTVFDMLFDGDDLVV